MQNILGIVLLLFWLFWEKIIHSYYFWGVLILIVIFLFWLFIPKSKPKYGVSKTKTNNLTKIEWLIKKINKEQKVELNQLLNVGIIKQKDIKGKHKPINKLLNTYISKNKNKNITKVMLTEWVSRANLEKKKMVNQIIKNNKEQTIQNKYENVKVIAKNDLSVIENINKRGLIVFSELLESGILPSNMSHILYTEDYLFIDKILNKYLAQNNKQKVTKDLLEKWCNDTINIWKKNRKYLSLLNKVKNDESLTILDLKKIELESIQSISGYNLSDILSKLNEELHYTHPKPTNIDELTKIIINLKMKPIEKLNHLTAQNTVKKYFLKKVIKRLPQKMKASTDSAVVTRYPTNPGITGFIGKKEIKYFEVNNNTDSRNFADNIQEVNINDFDTGMSIVIILCYRLSCPQGREESITEFLGASESPEKALEDFIDKFIHQFYNERLDGFVVNLAQNLKDLVLALDQEVEKQSGLKLVSKVSLKNADKVKDISLSDNIKVIPTGIEQSVLLKINYLLKADNKNIAALHMNTPSDIDDIKIKIKDIISGYITEKIDAHILLFKFMNKETELSELTDKINDMLMLYGRQIKFQNMHTPDIIVEKLAEVELEQARIPIDRINQNIIIKNKLQFELSDAGKYLENGMPNLKDWASRTLTELYQVKVFNWEYIDYLVNFEDLKSEIETTMREKASKIGYEINQIISEPKLAENAFLRMDTHMFEYKQLATADSGITGDLNVTVTFMLNDKKAFKELLKYDDNATESLKKMFEVELKKVLSYEAPERIFLQYYNDSFQGSTESLKVNLENKVRKHLMERLNATVQDIHIVPVDNGILEPLYAVRGQSKDIELELAPKIEGDPITYKATLVVHGQDNNNWSQLIEGKYNMVSIAELVVRTLKAEFNMLSEDELRFKTLEHRRGIEKIADKLAKEIVSKRFGLVVEIENLDRDKNSEEVLAHQNKKRQLEYVYNQKDSNLQYLSERNMQDREQMLHLSSTLDDEDKEEMNEYAKRVGVEEINISTSPEDKSTGISGLMKLAEETQSLEHLENSKNSFLNIEKSLEHKQLKNNDKKDEE